MLGLPNSLLNEAAPIGASIIIFKGEAIRSGLSSSNSHFSIRAGRRRWETENPVKPALGFAPIPVAPSSLISPPEPVDAPE